MSSRPKVFIIVLDGAGDRPIKSLGGQTPLEYAETPNLDSLAAQSRMTRVNVIGPGYWPESDSGAMAILSYDPLRHYTGRGPLEGLGAGMIRPDGRSIAFRANFGSLDDRAGRLDRRTARGLSDPELQQLAAEIRDRVGLRDLGPFDVSLIAFSHHRAILGISSEGPPLDGRVTNTDPGFRNHGVFGVPVHDFEPRPVDSRPMDPSNEAATRSAALVNAIADRAADVLRSSEINTARAARGELPANVLLIRDGGLAPTPLTPFRTTHGRTLHMFGQIFAEKGLAELIGAKFDFSRPSAAETIPSYLDRAAIDCLGCDDDVVFIHLKGPDEPGHDNLPLNKVSAIEAIDRHFVGTLLQGVPEGSTIIVCCDHATPCEMGIHSDDPVPVMVVRSDWPADGLTRFTERDADRGSLEIERMADMLGVVLVAASDRP